MKKMPWLLLVVAPVLFAAYALWRSSTPAPVSGGEGHATKTPGKTSDEDAKARALIAQIASQSAAEPVPAPAAPAKPPAPPVPGSGDGAWITAEAEQKELRIIDAYAAQEHQRIEAWYARESTRLKVLLEQRIQNLNEVDKLAWAQFQQRANETWSVTDGSNSESASGQTSRSATTRTLVQGNPAGDYAAILAKIKDSKQATQQAFTEAQQSLAWTRERELMEVQNEVDRRKAAIAQKKARAQMELARKVSGDQTPMVEAIAATADNQFCALIGDAFVHEGSIVQGYRVRKIQADSVEFEKDGKTWVQKVN